MESMKKILKDYPVAVSAVVTVGIIWAYHNGYLNALCSSPGKMLTSDPNSSTTNA